MTLALFASPSALDHGLNEQNGLQLATEYPTLSNIDSRTVSPEPSDVSSPDGSTRSKTRRCVSAIARLIHKLRLLGGRKHSRKHAKACSVSQFCSKPEVEAAAGALRPNQPAPNQTISFMDQSIATIRSASFRNQQKYSHIELLDETWEDWLLKYQGGSENLSEVVRPTCFCGFGYMAPPVHKYESLRLKAVSKVASASLWKPDLSWLNVELRRILAEFRLRAVCVSIVDRTTQQNMFEIGFGNRLETIGRELSLDAHTVLSKDYFALLDASSDWRTRLNPLVHGPPFIRFYLGVPLTIEKQSVGCISVSDPYLKTRVMPLLVQKLTEVSAKLSARLELRMSPPGSTCYNLNRIKWAGSEEEEKEDSESERCSTISGLSATSDICSSQSFLSLQIPVYDTRLQPLSCRSLIQPFEVFGSLLKCQTIPQVIKKGCRLVMQNLGADLVYVAEIRIQKPTLRQDATGSKAGVRLVGHCAPAVEIDVSETVESDGKLLQSAIESEFGIQFSTKESSELGAATGMIMPFRRSSSAIANLKVWSGGFVMAAYSIKPRTVSPGDIVFMKKVVRALENILSCHEEIQRIHD